MKTALSKNELNFSGGPGALPQSVLDEAQRAIACVPEVGLSILGISHRSDWFAAVVDETERNIKKLLGLPDTHAVLFLQGGATLQFSMVPMLLLRGSGKSAEYLRTGYWSSKSIPPATLEGDVRILWDGETGGFRRLPAQNELAYSENAAYLHYVSNETVEGLQFDEVLGVPGVPLVCDMSSDFLSRPFDPKRFEIVYAHAQKNIGPAGVTVVILDKRLLENAPNAPKNCAEILGMPGMLGIPELLDYKVHLAAHSIFNTPPVFAIYVVLLVTRWLLNDIGGLAKMDAINQAKADALYAVLDENADVYEAWVARENRSRMNVAFKFNSEELQTRFLAEAMAEGFSGLAGHRSLGGIRASIYNGMTPEAVAYLAQFMRNFAQKIA